MQEASVGISSTVATTVITVFIFGAAGWYSLIVVSTYGNAVAMVDFVT